MVIRLGESLELPLRERNELLLTAGFAPAYPETPLEAQALAPVMDALTHILAAHVPYPAIIVDRYGDIVAANAAQHILFEGCASSAGPASQRVPDSAAPRGHGAADRELPRVGPPCTGGLRADLRRNPDDRLAALYDGAEPATSRARPASRPPGLRGTARARSAAASCA